MGFRSIIRDLLFIYLAYKLMGVWLFGTKFTWGLGLLTIFLVIITMWFMIEKVFE
ncbi:MAG: hypothetical protein PHD81_04640 [Candidatus Nanoarchaeia archaeon]|nr:hypothetical protein [Candidatus Nanoarchaeia archaeon]MDD5588364.1 hypothetical protein [Candidatus Nanoarchaeia archaeon]